MIAVNININWKLCYVYVSFNDKAYMQLPLLQYNSEKKWIMLHYLLDLCIYTDIKCCFKVVEYNHGLILKFLFKIKL